MNSHEKQLFEKLIELRNEYHVIGVKVEFETECLAINEAMILKELAKNTDLDFTVKTGGSSSLKDINDAKILDANAIVAPMIESEYAMHKYIKIAKSVFNNMITTNPNDMNVKLLINIETLTGYKECEKILSADYDNDISGVVFGRTDFFNSLNIKDKTIDINSDMMVEYAIKIAQICKKYNKEVIIGGGISTDTIGFLEKIPFELFDKFETRKIIFNAKNAMTAKNLDTAILKAIEFELLWLEFKRDVLNIISKDDSIRKETLLNRYNNCASVAR